MSTYLASTVKSVVDKQKLTQGECINKLNYEILDFCSFIEPLESKIGTGLTINKHINTGKCLKIDTTDKWDQQLNKETLNSESKNI